jgi:hypothetical protein
VASTLNNSLAHYWPLNETSGTRYAYKGGADLSVQGSVSFATGINSVSLSSASDGLGSNYLSHSTASFGGTEITVGGWIYFDDSTDGSTYLVSAGSLGFWLRNINGDLYAGNTTVNHSIVGALSAGGWHLIAAKFIDSAGIGISVDGGAWDFSSIPSASFSSDPDIVIGQPITPPSGETTRFDEVAIWNRSLTDAELAEWWNSGSGSFAPYSDPLDEGTLTLEGDEFTTLGAPELTLEGDELNALADGGELTLEGDEFPETLPVGDLVLGGDALIYVWRLGDADLYLTGDRPLDPAAQFNTINTSGVGLATLQGAGLAIN